MKIVFRLSWKGTLPSDHSPTTSRSMLHLCRRYQNSSMYCSHVLVFVFSMSCDATFCQSCHLMEISQLEQELACNDDHAAQVGFTLNRISQFNLIQFYLSVSYIVRRSPGQDTIPGVSERRQSPTCSSLCPSLRRHRGSSHDKS